MFDEIEWGAFKSKPQDVKAYQFNMDFLYHGIIYPAGSWVINDGKTEKVLPDSAFKSIYE